MIVDDKWTNFISKVSSICGDGGEAWFYKVLSKIDVGGIRC